MENRYFTQLIIDDALESEKMALIVGPRQCGKTTLAKNILKKSGEDHHYFNWDNEEFQRLWIKSTKEFYQTVKRSDSKVTLVLDELHKYKNWKNSLKGFYDQYKNEVKIIVTGSAKLNFYRKSGDSLVGRYLPYHLHPFSMYETDHLKQPPTEKRWKDSVKNDHSSFTLKDLLELGPFPEPLLAGSKIKADRWWKLYRDQIIREDLRDVKAIKDLNMVSVLANILQDKVAAHLSYKSLTEDLKIAFATAKDWVETLESVYYCFIIRPYSKKITGALQKEPKLYLYHWAGIQNGGAKLENLVACHLLKSVQAWTDSALGTFDLHYIKDKYKREVDFLITKDQKPWLLLEVKSSEKEPTESLKYYTKKLQPIYSIQIGCSKKEEKIYFDSDFQIEMLSVETFLAGLT